MTVRFLADEDLHNGLIAGLQSREPAIDTLSVKTAGMRGMTDPDLLELAAQQGRILITHDRTTMPGYFLERLNSGQPNSGLLVVPVVPQQAVLGEIIESPLLMWAASQAEEWRNEIVYLPFR